VGTRACTRGPRRPTELHENPGASGVAQALLPAASPLIGMLFGVRLSRTTPEPACHQPIFHFDLLAFAGPCV